MSGPTPPTSRPMSLMNSEGTIASLPVGHSVHAIRQSGADTAAGGNASENDPLLPRSNAGPSVLPPPNKLKRENSSQSEHQSKWAKFYMKSQYYVPALEWIPNYSLDILLGDIAGGFSVASVLIPQSMSYATSLAHLDASAGLLGSAIPGLIYSLFGTTRQLNVGPEAALSLLVGQTISNLVPGDPHSEEGRRLAEAVATVLIFQVGLISFVLGFFRLGFLDVILSRSLLRGFITAVACVILIEQLIPMFGLEDLQHSLPEPPVSTIEKFIFLIENVWPHGKPLTAAISFISLAILITVRAIKRRIVVKGGRWKIVQFIPEVFVLVVVTTILSNEFDWNRRGVAILGLMKVNISQLLAFPIDRTTIRYLPRTTSTALLISIAGFLDSISAAKQNSSRFQYSISPNRELVALGAGNLVGSFFPGTLMAYGSITRSRMSADAGARSQFASVVCSALTLLALFFLLPVLKYLPKCVLAAIIGLVVNSILSEAPHDVLYYWRMRSWPDLSLMLVTMIVTLVWNVEAGIIVSVSASLVMIVRGSSKAHVNMLGRVPGTNRWKPVTVTDDAMVDGMPEEREEIPGVMIVRIRDDLDFANTGHLKERFRRMEIYGAKPMHPSAPARRRAGDTRAVVFHMADVEKIDASATIIMKEAIQAYRSRGVQVYFAHLRSQHKKSFRKAGIIPDLVPESHLQENVASAMAELEHDVVAGTA